MKTIFDITEYGAVGDGKTDCTQAIQAALDDATKCQGEVIVPPGNYLSGEVKMGPHTALVGSSAWSFGPFGGSVITLNDPKAACLVNITGAFGCRVQGLSLVGNDLGENIHGIMINWPVYDGGGHEDTPTVDDCKVGRFTGDGIHFEHVWCFSIRHSQLCFNKGAGLYCDGWDAFIIDNWFSGNRNCGILGGPISSAITATGNRVEWNWFAGFSFVNGNSINITGNYFDRSYGPGVRLGTTAPTLTCAGNFFAGEASAKGHTFVPKVREVTITGNIFRRSGKAEGGCLLEPEDSSHIRLTGVDNCAISANSFGASRDDDGRGKLSPDYGAVIKKSDGVVMTGNTMKNGMVLEGILYDGEGDNLVKDNVGAPIGNYDARL